MLGAEVRTLLNVDGTPVCNVSFDLSAMQLAVCARIVDAVRITRFRGDSLSTDDVIALQEMTALSDELHRLSDHDAHGTVVLPLARFSALHDALTQWVAELDERGWARDEEAEDRPVAEALIGPMASLRAEAVQAVLGASSPQAL